MASPEEMVEKMIANLKEKTGKTLAQWVKIAAGAGLEKHGQIVNYLKSEHGMTHGYANLVTQKTLEKSAPPQTADPVETQYAGKKSALRPIYDKLIREIGKFGGDVEVSPRKTYVSLRRSKQFAIIQPSTATRIDIGLKLPDAAAKGRLEDSGSFSGMVSHRVRVENAKQVDRELIGWLRKAYDRG